MFADVHAISLLDWSHKGGLIGGKGLEKQIGRHLPECIDDLKLPFQTVAVDIQAGRVYVFFEGPIKPALRATSAVPGMGSLDIPGYFLELLWKLARNSRSLEPNGRVVRVVEIRKSSASSAGVVP